MGIATKTGKSFKSRRANSTTSTDSLISKMIEVGKDKKKVGKTVSMRCRRHRQRFEVEDSWLKTCSYLCPKCYNKLSSIEREKYMPASMRAKKSTEQAIESTQTEEPTHINEVVSVKEPRIIMPVIEFAPLVLPPMSKSMAALIPEWRVGCCNCRKIKAVHKMWLDNTSKVLCPDCYSTLSQAKIDEFHTIFPASKATFYKDNTEIKITADPIILPKTKDSLFGGGCNNKFIRNASDKELLKAMKSGRLSKVRYRIEMNRRKNRAFYDSIPDVAAVAV